MRRHLILSIVMTLAAAGAEAQPAPWQPERLTAGWVFTPSLVVGALWDSNVTVQNKGEVILSEWVGLLNPRGELDFNGRRTHFNVGYSGSLEAYRTFEELNRYEQRGRLELRQQISPRLSLFSNSSLTRAPTTDRLDLGTGALPFVDVGSRIFNLSGGLRLEASRRTHIEGRYGFENVEFDRDEAAGLLFLQGGQSHSISTRVMQDITARFSAGGFWQYQHADVESALDTIFDVHNISGEVAYRLSETTRVSGGFGVSRLRESSLDLTASGPAYHVALSQQAGQASFGISYDRAFVPSFTFGGVTTNQNFSVSGRYPFARGRFYTAGSLSYGRTDPVEELGPDLGFGFRLDSVWISAALGYQVAPWLRAEGFYNGAHQTSSARGDVDRSRIGFQIVTLKPMRIQ